MVALNAIHAMPCEMPTKYQKLLVTLHTMKIFYDQKKTSKHYVRTPWVAFNSQTLAASSIEHIVRGPSIKQIKQNKALQLSQSNALLSSSNSRGIEPRYKI